MNITVENLTKDDFKKVCRSCLSVINLHPLYDNTSQCDLLRNMLVNYTRLKLYFDDQLPKQICEQCTQKLIDFARFISNCNKINSVFLKLIDISNANEISTSLININTEVPSAPVVTQAFKTWLNGLQKTSDVEKNISNQNKYGEIEADKPIITNVVQREINNKTSEEFETLVDEIKEEVLDDTTIKDEIVLEYSTVNSEESKNGPESPIEIKANFNCDTCKRVFEDEVCLHFHKAEHKIAKTFNCQKCNMFFKSLNEFLAHCMTHREIITIDGLTDTNGSNKRQKLTQEQNVVDKYMCNVCLNVFSDKLGLIEHQKKHGKDEKSCSVCFQLFENSSELSKHAKTHLKQKRLFVCDICLKPYKYLSNLQLHKDMHHAKPIIYLCGLCPASFATENLLDCHRQLHCNICSKFYKDKTALLFHENEHKNDLSYKTQMNGKRKQDTDEHMISVVSSKKMATIDSEIEEDPLENNNEKKTYLNSFLTYISNRP